MCFWAGQWLVCNYLTGRDSVLGLPRRNYLFPFDCLNRFRFSGLFLILVTYDPVQFEKAGTDSEDFSFVVSFLAILMVRVPGEQQSTSKVQKPNFLREFTEGLRFYAQNHLMLTIFISALIVTLGTGAMNALDVFFVTQNLHVPANLYGTLGMAFGIGSISGAVLGGMFTKRIGVARTFWLGLMVSGLFVTFFVSHKRMWVRVLGQGAKSRIEVAGTTNKNPVGLQKERHHLMSTLQNEFDAKG